MTPGERPRVVLVEDHALIRSRVAAVLASSCDVVGTAENGTSALREIAILDPDVVVLDVSLPDISGLDVAAQLRRAGNTVLVIFLSGYDDDELKRAALAAGGDRYVVKSDLSRIASEVLDLTATRPRANPLA
jgi:DNA-binding NarL/FixJ family response regulator